MVLTEVAIVMGPLERVIAAGRRLGRRRGRLILQVLGVEVALALVVCEALPAEHRARAVVAPVTRGHDGPIERTVELSLSPSALGAVAHEARVREHRTPGEVAVGLPADPGQRLRAQLEPVRGPSGLEHVVVQATGVTAEQAVLAADALAARLVACDAAQADPAAAAAVGTSAPPTRVARARLEALRAERGALLRDAGLEERHRSVAARIADDRVALAGLRAQLSGATEEAERLEALARDEAARALRLHREEEAARLAAASAAPARPAPVVVAAVPAPAGAPDRLATLEAELQRLRATLTDRHPEVRRAQRLLEVERRAHAAAPAPAPAPDAPQDAAHPRGEAVQAPPPAPRAPLVFAVADDAPPAPAQAPAEAAPDTWLARAPSYGLWAAARARLEATRVDVDAREQALAARLVEAAGLERAVAAQAEVRAEEARLAAAAAAEAAAAPSPAADLRAIPLRVVEPAAVVEARSPWRHLPPALLLAALAAVLVAAAVDASDRTPHGVEDLDGLGVPVLGVIPWLRGGR